MPLFSAISRNIHMLLFMRPLNQYLGMLLEISNGQVMIARLSTHSQEPTRSVPQWACPKSIPLESEDKLRPQRHTCSNKESFCSHRDSVCE